MLHTIGPISTPINRAALEYLAVDDIEIIGGSLPVRQARLVTAWAEIHRRELLENWGGVRRGRS